MIMNELIDNFTMIFQQVNSSCHLHMKCPVKLQLSQEGTLKGGKVDGKAARTRQNGNGSDLGASSLEATTGRNTHFSWIMLHP